MILRTPCTKCNGQVLERDGLDGFEQLCLNCGFGQVANIVPTEALADESEDYNLRNRSNGMLTKRGLVNRKFKGKGFPKGFHKPVLLNPRQNPRQKVTLEQVESWKKFQGEMEKIAKEAK